MSYYIIAATAGHDTTSATSAGAMWALAERPEQFAKAKADNSLIPGLVEEAIRWVTPVKHFMRSATQDSELAGQKIAKGDWMMLCYPSGNRDETVFQEPVRVRYRAHAQQTIGVRLWRPCMHRPAPRPNGIEDPLGRTAPAPAKRGVGR
jgi:cytochrome P450